MRPRHNGRAGTMVARADGGGRRRVVRRVFCDRPKQAHTLAMLRVEGDERVVDAT